MSLFAALCYNAPVDTTIRNLDQNVYRAIKARAALRGRTVGDVVNEALRAYLDRPVASKRRASLRALQPEPYPEGNEKLSREIDSIVYGR